jgi:hypothetical protein
MNKFLSFGNSVNTVVTNETTNDANDAADDGGDDGVINVPIDDARVTQNTIILQNQSSVPNLTNFLGDVYTSGIIRTSGIEVTGDIIINNKILSTSSSDTTDLTLMQEQLNELQTQVNSFINQDEVNELNEQVSDLTFQNTTNLEINNLKLNLLILETRFNSLTNS